MCTHQMHQVEELCDRIVLIDHGRSMLYGPLEEVRQQYAGNDVILRTNSDLPAGLSSSMVEKVNGHSYKISLATGQTPQEFLQKTLAAGVVVDGFEIAIPDLDEIFIRVVQSGPSTEQPA
jgi:ABC-2 type transport system ATP-binding protein